LFKICILQNRNIQDPPTRTPRKGLRDIDIQDNSTVVRKGARQHIARQDMVEPRVRATYKINMRGQGPIGFQPRKSHSGMMQDPPSINHATIIKNSPKGTNALPRCIKYIGTTSVYGPIKDSIKIPTKQRGNGRVNQRRTVSKEVVPLWIPIRSVQRDYTKCQTMPLQLRHNKATIRICPGSDEGKTRTK